MVTLNVSFVLAPVVLLECLLKLLLNMNIPQPHCLLSALCVVHLVLAQAKGVLSLHMQS